MDILAFLPYWLLVFVRLASFFLAAPVWKDKQVPGHFKIGFAFFTTVLVSGVIEPVPIAEMDSIYTLLILKETIVGLSLGFFASVLIYAIQLGGSFVDMQSGLAMSTMFNPQTGVQEHITGRFYYAMAILLFLAVDGHHILLQGAIASFQWIPPEMWLPSEASENMAKLSLSILKNMFWIAVLIAAPMLGTIFMVDIALGMLSKMVPQMNLFVVGIPIKLFAHYIVLFVTMPVFFYVVGMLIRVMTQSTGQLLKMIGT
ncbi:flagellar type III secretion system protein FliR [Neobacillus notoginsengisoli]|uniref:Flagellar biosynthetic protein FliR n=1 Tax=Neobacillus notoginsengisoli TaxID=1578198 RepID=A0A417YJQ2_9BACI|nr:flagellar biosynthetic protein FliR [Neobacillus notoginsengisoli]RHW33300.1 flagellar type III secretion system protein FliR [Neobacillus notoginsengisoli]